MISSSGDPGYYVQVCDFSTGYNLTVTLRINYALNVGFYSGLVQWGSVDIIIGEGDQAQVSEGQLGQFIASCP